MNNIEEFETWYQKTYTCFGQANFQLNSYGEYVDDDIEASWCAWQAALASQEPTLKNNEFIPDSTEGRIQAAIKCLNMHWVSHDANRFDYAIEGLEKCLAGLASQAQQEPAKAKHHPICDRRYPSLCDACNAEAQAKRIAELEDRLSSFPIPTSVAMQKIGKLRSEGFKEYAATVLNKKNQYCIVGDYGDVRWLSKNGE